MASLADGIRFLRTSKRRARYLGHVGYGNLGDEALFSATADLFGDDVCFYWRERMGFPATLLPRSALDAIFLGGGTIIKGPSRHLKRVREAMQRYPGAKFVVFGTGVGDAALWERFGYPTDTRGWLDTLEQSAYLGVRGPLSKKHLEQWGIQREVKVIGDPVLWYAREAIRPKSLEKRVGLNLGPSAGRIHGADEAAVLDFGAELIRCLDASGWRITLFPMVEDDVAYLLQAVDKAGVGPMAMHTGFDDLPATLEAIEAQDVFVGEKLHSVVFACCVYTPAVMLEYRTKCLDFMLSINRGEWTFRTDELDVERVYQAVTDLYAATDDHQQALFGEMQRWKRELRAAADEVMQLMGAE